MRVEKALANVPGVTSASVNLATETASVNLTAAAAAAASDALIAAVKKAGYEAALLAPPDAAPELADADVASAPETASGAAVPTAAERKRSQTRRELVAVIVSALLTLPLVLPMLGQFRRSCDASAWLQLALASVVQFVFGARFYVAVARAAGEGGQHGLARRARHVGGVGLERLSDARRIPASSMHLYFEASAVVITLVRFGKWLEARAKRQTTDAIRALNALRPDRGARARRPGEREIALADVASAISRSCGRANACRSMAWCGKAARTSTNR